MGKVMISTRIPEDLGHRLDELAENTNRSKAYILNAALEDYVARHSWLTDKINAAIQDADSSGEFISQEAMERWADSLGTEKPLPPPPPDVFKRKRA